MQHTHKIQLNKQKGFSHTNYKTQPNKNAKTIFHLQTPTPNLSSPTNLSAQIENTVHLKPPTKLTSTTTVKAQNTNCYNPK